MSITGTQNGTGPSGGGNVAGGVGVQGLAEDRIRVSYFMQTVSHNPVIKNTYVSTLLAYIRQSNITLHSLQV